MSLHLARLNEQLSLRAAFSASIGNPTARRALAAKLAEVSVVRVDAAEFDAEFLAAERFDAHTADCDERFDLLDDAEKRRNPHYLAGLADLERRQSGHSPKTTQTETQSTPMSNSPAAAERKRKYLESVRPLHDGPLSQQEQQRLDAAERDYDQQIANERARQSTHYTRGAADGATRLDKKGPFDADGRTEEDPAGVEEGKKARARMQTRATNAWRTGPLSPAEQRQVDLGRASRDPDDAA